MRFLNQIIIFWFVILQTLGTFICNDTYSCDNGFPIVFGYHLHVLFDADVELDAASKSRDLLISELNTTTCGFSEGQLLSNISCALDFVKQNPLAPCHGPCIFPSAMYSFYVTSRDLPFVTKWALININNTWPVLIHTQTGCQIYDHMIWETWLMNKVVIDPHTLPCMCAGYQPNAGLTNASASCNIQIEC